MKCVISCLVFFVMTLSVAPNSYNCQDIMLKDGKGNELRLSLSKEDDSVHFIGSLNSEVEPTTSMLILFRDGSNLNFSESQLAGDNDVFNSTRLLPKSLFKTINKEIKQIVVATDNSDLDKHYYFFLTKQESQKWLEQAKCVINYQ